MFLCPKCDLPIVSNNCPVCGRTSVEPDEIAQGFIEFLRTGQDERPEPEPPSPFRQRLAAYLDRDESELFCDHQVPLTMPLRVLAPIGPYHGPKSRWLIRFLLHRIDDVVREFRQA